MTLIHDTGTAVSALPRGGGFLSTSLSAHSRSCRSQRPHLLSSKHVLINQRRAGFRLVPFTRKSFA